MVRLATGIAGFDSMLGGGLPEGSSVVLQGPPGQEKLLVALTFLAEGLKQGGAGVFIISSQSAESILSELRRLGVDLDAVAKENRLRIVDWYSWAEETITDVEERGIILRSSIDLSSAGAALSRAIASLPSGLSTRAVVEILSPATNVYELNQVYAFAQSTKRKLDRFAITALFVLEKEMHAPAVLSTLTQPFDGVIEMERTRSGDRIVRKIGVLHLKDTTPDTKFLPLEMTERGFRVVVPGREPRPAAQPPKAVPGRRSVSVPLLTEAETPENRQRRVHLILEIAKERIAADPSDKDAWFALAAGQATLGDIQGSLASLDRLVALDERYPGLWVLKAKLHARLGQEDEWRQARMKADEYEEPAAVSPADLVPCPVCAKPIAKEASLCPHCGSRTEPEMDIIEELEDLTKATIQDLVEEHVPEEPEAEAPPEPIPEPEAPVPAEAAPAAEDEAAPEDIVAPLDELEALMATAEPEAPTRKVITRKRKEEGRKGLTNGLILEQGAARRAIAMSGGQGRTNGLTNGLRGRTNGLTNGLGRTNGLTNGLGHTNGLTNGLRGRTNGLTNGLRGRTNGLTNGLGRTNGLKNLSGMAKFQGRVSRSPWTRYGIPVAVIVLLIIPLFFLWGGPTTNYPIRIDGQFDDWAGVSKLNTVQPPVVPNPDVDLTRVAVKDNVDDLAFYLEVRGTVLAGGPAPQRVTNAFYAFLDTDRARGTGYQLQGIGADRMIRINTWGGQVVGTALYEFDPGRGAQDWNGWVSLGSVAAAGSGSRMEFQTPWADLGRINGPVEVAFASRSWDGQSDAGDVVVTSADPYLIVSQNTAAPQVLNGSATTLAQFTLHAVDGAVTVNAINITFQGTFGPASISAVDIMDAAGNLLAERPLASVVQFSLPPLVLSNNQTQTLSVRPKVGSPDGTTIGAFVKNVQDVSVVTGGVAFVSPVSLPSSLAYIGASPPGPHVDGAFAEWRNPTMAGVGNVQPIWDQDIDLATYEFKGSGGATFFMASVVGTALNGTMIPALNPAYVSPSGNGTASNGTLAPPPPPMNGTDFVRFYLDVDGASVTGYQIGGIGADYLVEIEGKGGLIRSAEATRFSGSSPWDWKWTRIGSVSAAKDLSHIEAELPGIGITNASRAFFEVSGWNDAYDASASPASPVLGDPTIITSTGTVKWSIGDSTWKSGPSLPAAPAGGSGLTTGWNALLVLPNNNTFAIATESTTYKLMSSTTTWTLFISPTTTVPDQPKTNIVAITSDTANTYYAMTAGQTGPAKNNQVYQFTGTSPGNWVLLVSFGPFNIVAMAWVSGTGTGATLYALQSGSNTQLLRSTNGGSTWAAFGTALPATSGSNVGMSVHSDGAISVLLNNGTIERSTNTASTWTWIPKAGSSPSGTVWTDVASDADGNLWAVTDKFVWSYTLSTNAWANMTGTLSVTSLVSIDAMIPTAANAILNTGGTSKWTGGGSWRSLPALPAPNTSPEGGAGSWEDLVTTSANVTYAIEDDSTVYKLASGGASWVLFLSPPTSPSDRPNTNVIGIAADGANTFFAITRGSTSAPAKNNQVYRYTGTTAGNWPTPVATITAVNIVDLEWVSGTGSSATLYYLPQALATQLSKSTNGGTSWATFGTAPPASGAPTNVGLTVDSSGSIGLLLTNGTVERSTNGGSTWAWIPKSAMSPSGNIWVDIAADAGGNLWTATGTAIWKYDISQGTWTNMTGTLSIANLVAISIQIPEFGDSMIPVVGAFSIPISFQLRRRRHRRSA